MTANNFEEKCYNKGCDHKLKQGANVGGWRATRQKNGGYTNGYTCKKCGNQSTPSTSQLRLYQQTQHYNNITNNEIEHKRAWQKLTASLSTTPDPPQNKKMPKWENIQIGAKKEAKAGQ